MKQVAISVFALAVSAFGAFMAVKYAAEASGALAPTAIADVLMAVLMVALWAGMGVVGVRLLKSDR